MYVKQVKEGNLLSGTSTPESKNVARGGMDPQGAPGALLGGGFIMAPEAQHEPLGPLAPHGTLGPHLGWKCQQAPHLSLIHI